MLASVEENLDLSNLHQPSVLANPYPFYRELRIHDPVHWDSSTSSWLITRYADVIAAIHNPLFSVEQVSRPSEDLPPSVQKRLSPLFEAFARHLPALDPPRHTPLRAILNKEFTPAVVEQMRPRIWQLAESLLDKVGQAGQMDVISDLAYPFPILVIMEKLNLPLVDYTQIQMWCRDLFAFVGGFNNPPRWIIQAGRSLTEIVSYLREIVQVQRRHRQKNLLDVLICAQEQGYILDEQELLLNCVMLLMGGHETTKGLIGNGVLALLSHPEQLQKLKADPSLMSSAIVEILRYDCPNHLLRRTAKADLEFRGRQIRQNQNVFLMVGAANRDPDQFCEPDRFDITRRDTRQLAFGQGIHYCLGAPLAKIEAEIAIKILLQRLPNLKLETAGQALDYESNIIFHGLKALPVSF